MSVWTVVRDDDDDDDDSSSENDGGRGQGEEDEEDPDQMEVDDDDASHHLHSQQQPASAASALEAFSPSKLSEYFKLKTEFSAFAPSKAGLIGDDFASSLVGKGLPATTKPFSSAPGNGLDPYTHLTGGMNFFDLKAGMDFNPVLELGTCQGIRTEPRLPPPFSYVLWS